MSLRKSVTVINTQVCIKRIFGSFLDVREILIVLTFCKTRESFRSLALRNFTFDNLQANYYITVKKRIRLKTGLSELYNAT